MVRDTDDPGDATNRNFRYQHAYGVILLAAARRGALPYVAIYCEHHEDFLAERQDASYDAYQIKTSRPEGGAWRMNDEDLVKSIGRFVDLVQQFGDRIANVYFVTNTEFDHVADNHADQKRRGRRPRAFLQHVKACPDHTAIAAPYRSVFTDLQAECGCQASELFMVLLRTDLKIGPSRDSFHAVVAHEHLPPLPECAGLLVAELDAWCDRLIAIVCAASSLVVTTPDRHVHPLLGGNGRDPVIVAKRLVVADIMITPRQGPQFRFRAPPTMELGAASRPTVLQAKLERGDLADQVDYLNGRSRDTEFHLIEEASRSTADALELIRRLEEVVLGECSEAQLRERLQGEPYGPRMMIAIQNRLRQIAESEPARVGGQSYDCLMGIVSLLTCGCRVWWSPRFLIQEPTS